MFTLPKSHHNRLFLYFLSLDICNWGFYVARGSSHVLLASQGAGPSHRNQRQISAPLRYSDRFREHDRVGLEVAFHLTAIKGRLQYIQDKPRLSGYVRIGPETANHWLLIFRLAEGRERAAYPPYPQALLMS